ncbi:hypothetical protein OAC89_00445 [Deltaproteobacteria bacterium]|nr:hypothetical protein [Deltaproteobacteria bacterium]
MKKISYTKDSLLVLTAGIVLFLSYLIIFMRFLPNKYGLMGHDYSLVFPSLLDNFIWLKKNGIWEIPWFTPSFCGGFLNFAHPQGAAYSLPVLFTIFMDPLSSILLTFVLFALLGFLSSYLLLRSGFSLSQPSSFFGAGLFLFNGFYSHRMLVGHFGFYPFMIIPLLIFLLIRPAKTSNSTYISKEILFDILAAGILFAYMVYSGYLSLMLPSIFAVIIVGMIHGLLYPSSRLLFWLRLAGSGLTGILLSSSKLVTISYIMDNFTRSDYKLPGAEGFIASAWLILKSLFSSPAFDTERIESLVNQQWYLDRHEWEFSLTIAPLLIIIWGLIKFGSSIKKGDIHKNFSSIKKYFFIFFMLIILLIIPVALNTYSPSWNAFLKNVPLIKSASSLIRWYIIYIPFVCLITSLIIEKMVQSKIKWPLVLTSMLIVVGFNSFTDHQYYHDQGYDPQKIQNAYIDLKNNSWTPEIKYIVLCVNENGQIVKTADTNDALIINGSQLLCYEPLLGYRQEYLPVKTLHPGPVLEENEGVFNIKNPACYVWPEVNSCEPGDHFTVEQKKDATAFVQYEPFTFYMPGLQRFANWFNLIFLVVVILYLGFHGITCLLSSRKKG